MSYNFDEIVDRSNNYAAKFQEAELHYGTNNVIPLWIADMDFRTAPCIVDAIKERADQGIFGYTWRTPKYFEAIAAWQQKRNGWLPDIAKMAFAPGVVPGMRMVLTMFTQPGDKVLIQQPVYHPFADVVNNTGRQLVVSPLKRDENGYYTMDLEDFEAKAKDGAKYFILCNPHNPLGRVWTKEELERMLTICFENDVLVVSDEIHSDLIFHGKKHTPAVLAAPGADKKVITCISVTKTFNLAGLQASTTVFPCLEMKKKFDSYWGGMDIHRNNAFSSVAMEAALNEGEEWLEQLLEYISGNLDYIKEYFDTMIPLIRANIPDATYLVWLDCRKLNMTDQELKEFMIRKAGLGLNPGSDFTRALSGFMRLNAACPRATLEKALGQLERAVNELAH